MFLLPPLPAGKPWTVLGLMAGTSADGADAASAAGVPGNLPEVAGGRAAVLGCRVPG